jgi:hypothetical protein
MEDESMSEQPSYRTTNWEQLRVLFCLGVTPRFFELPGPDSAGVIVAITEAFDDLAGRFGVRVLGTMDDDELMVGSSAGWPWTAYVLAEAPDLEAVRAVCNIIRDASAGEFRLWRYLRIEARIGRPLFFAKS